MKKFFVIGFLCGICFFVIIGLAWNVGIRWNSMNDASYRPDCPIAAYAIRTKSGTTVVLLEALFTRENEGVDDCIIALQANRQLRATVVVPRELSEAPVQVFEANNERSYLQYHSLGTGDTWISYDDARAFQIHRDGIPKTLPLAHVVKVSVAGGFEDEMDGERCRILKQKWERQQW